MERQFPARVSGETSRLYPIIVILDFLKAVFWNSHDLHDHVLITKLNWRDHKIKKRKHIDLRINELYCLLSRGSTMSLKNKILLYKTIIIPIWTYGIKLEDVPVKSVAIIQRVQSKIFRTLAHATWHVTNQMLHQDLRISSVQEIIHLLLQLLVQKLNNRRLKRTWLTDLK